MSRLHTLSTLARLARAGASLAGLAGLAAPLAAQGRATMGVSVMVASAAPRASVTGDKPSFARHRSGDIEMRSRLSLVSQGEFTLLVRANGGGGAGAGSIQVRTADGSFAPLLANGSTVVTRARGSIDARSVDLVLRLDSTSARADLTAELVAASLDQ